MGAFAGQVSRTPNLPPKVKSSKGLRSNLASSKVATPSPETELTSSSLSLDIAPATAPAPDFNGLDPLAEEVAISAEQAEDFIENKRIGERIKFLRTRKQMGLVELGRYTGLSASFLSQLETGRVVPTLRNLARIAMVFSKDMSYFFEPERTELFRIVRAADRHRMPQTGAEQPDYFFENLGQVPAEQVITPYVAEFVPLADGRQPKAHRHTGNEFLYVLSGKLRLSHDAQEEMLDEGDAVFFNADAVHSYERAGDTECSALILTMPEPLRGAHSGSRIPMASGPAATTRRA